MVELQELVKHQVSLAVAELTPAQLPSTGQEIRALSWEKKEFVRARDGYRCRCPYKHNCNEGEDTLHVHHITPFRWGLAHGMSVEVLNGLCNLLTVCEEVHMGGRRNSWDTLIHPDMPETRWVYGGGDKDAYKKCFAERDRLTKLNIPFWNFESDYEMYLIARKNTLSWLHKEQPQNMTPLRRLRDMQYQVAGA